MTEAKKKALLTYKRNPSSSTHDACRPTRINVQQTAHHCTKGYWLKLCSKIQNAADTGNAKEMDYGIKKATGLSATKTALLKTKSGEVITYQSRQLEHWVEHYCELYATQNVVSDAALEALPHLTGMGWLDTMPTVEELRKAIDCLTSRKVPGKDGIPSEVL